MNPTLLRQKYPGLLERLGTLTDDKLALEYGITQARVCQIRNNLDIPAARRQVKTVPTEKEWQVFLETCPGQITIGADRKSIVIEGTTITGRSFRHAVLVATRGAK
jgi:hypothetical protein